MTKYKMPTCHLPEGLKVEPDYEFLKQLLEFQTLSGYEIQDLFIIWIQQWVETNGIEAEMHKDGYGNLYITKGQSELYPCIVAHVDINQDYKEDFDIVMSSKYMFGFDNIRGEQCGLGFDDKVGVYFALQMLLRDDVPNLKVFLSKDEEVGCKGTHKAEMAWFKDCSLLMQLDRRSDDNDISSYTNSVKVVSKEFITFMKSINEKYGYDFTECMYTDIGELKKQGLTCIAFNISCGYFNEHTDDEVLSLDHFVNAINYGWEILTSVPADKKWEHVSEVVNYAKRYAATSAKTSPIKGDPYYFDMNDYGDWYDEPPKKSKVWHSTPNWQFNKEDEAYIDSLVDVGTCPLCNDTLIDLKEGMCHCESCESTFNIPYHKTILDVEDEIFAHLYGENIEGQALPI